MVSDGLQSPSGLPMVRLNAFRRMAAAGAMPAIIAIFVRRRRSTGRSTATWNNIKLIVLELCESL